MDGFTPHKDGGYVFTVRLTPKAAKNALSGWIDGPDGQKQLKATVTAILEKGKANKALIALLAKNWKIPKTSLTLIRGETDRVKVLKINELP